VAKRSNPDNGHIAYKDQENTVTTLNIGNTELNSEEVARKVEEDIAFLSDRLHLLEQQSKPNAVILQTYKDMLESRRAVLDWLRQGDKSHNEHQTKAAS
jgi:hypothetical protein